MTQDVRPVPAQHQFGMFTLDLATGELFNLGTKVKLQERPFQLLVALVEKHGEIVGRDDLRQRLWPDGTFVDFDHGISSCINKLRAALNDSARHPRYVETVGRRGYRFVCPVTLSSLTNPSAVIPESPPPAQPLVGRRILAILSAAVLTISLIVLGLTVRKSDFRTPRPIRTLAVLPLKNLSSDVAQDYFSEGLTDELITRLASLKGVRVISRTSVMRYKNSSESLPIIAQALHVDAIVEGSVLRSGDHIRVTAQLIDATSDEHIWADSYERDQGDLLALQNEVALDIAQKIDLNLAPEDRERLTSARPVDQEAHEDYLRGRYHWSRRNAAELRLAIGYFEKAIARDPGYARAYAGLADCYALMSGYTIGLQDESIPKARAAALKAIELDDKLAEAHTSLALISQNYDWDWQTAEREFRRAIELDPNYATGHHWYAEHLVFQGRFDEAFVEMQRARQLDPLSLVMAADNAVFLLYARQYDSAIEQFRAVDKVDPHFPRVLLMVSALVQKGMFAEALAELERHEGGEDLIWPCALRAYIYGRWHHSAQARHELAQLQRLTRHQRIDTSPFLVVSAGVEDRDMAFAQLSKAYAEHSPSLTALKVDPIYDPLRGDPRFEDLLRRVGLQQ
jgi:TolB-like protein/DNA-binding winged helix-turn-helix (wHTH) protein/Tfp pilus assembly protein PilF